MLTPPLISGLNIKLDRIGHSIVQSPLLNGRHFEFRVTVAHFWIQVVHLEYAPDLTLPSLAIRIVGGACF